jgi:hypothetical protein
LGKIDYRSPNELEVVSKLIDICNNSANPGLFEVIRTSSGRIVVAGISSGSCIPEVTTTV